MSMAEKVAVCTVNFPQINRGYRKNQTSMWIVIAEILGEPFGSGISSFSNVVHRGKYWWISSNVRNLEYLTSWVVNATATASNSNLDFFFFLGGGDGGRLTTWSCDCYKSPRYTVGCHIHVLLFTLECGLGYVGFTATVREEAEQNHAKGLTHVEREGHVCALYICLRLSLCTSRLR